MPRRKNETYICGRQHLRIPENVYIHTTEACLVCAREGMRAFRERQLINTKK
jgi:hypothetical protein